MDHISREPSTVRLQTNEPCPLCGEGLEVQLKVEAKKVKIEEEAKCRHCKVTARKQDHTVH